MAVEISDKSLLQNIINHNTDVWISETEDILKERFKKKNIDIAESHELKQKLLDSNPLDSTVLKELGEIAKLVAADDPNILYKNINKILDTWTLLIKKSLTLLRICDLREPYLEVIGKNPSPYGLSELQDFMKSYQEYEKLLYATPNYRDHIVHVFKTWLVGMNIFTTISPNYSYFNDLRLEGVDETLFKLSPFEKISIWTLISLCHDLGYPLEKAQKILEKTTGMLKYFVANPQIMSDIKFTDTQDKMNQIIIEMASSKIIPTNEEKTKFNSVIQPKYYMKFLKSFEKNSHGLISSIILYKLLLYFMESEFSPNVNYEFLYTDAEQYLIRREILRAISSHTTKDIYYLNANTFSFLLTFCDDLQEWGRRDWNSMYSSISNDKEITIEKFEKIEDSYNIELTEKFTKELSDNDLVKIIQQIFEYQFISYRTIFRDGLDTQNRTFNFEKKFQLKLANGTKVAVNFKIKKDEQAEFVVDLDGIADKLKTEVLNNLSTDKYFLEKTPMKIAKDTKEIKIQ